MKCAVFCVVSRAVFCGWLMLAVVCLCGFVLCCCSFAEVSRFPHRFREKMFLLEPGVTFLNHGSFGATPKPVMEAEIAYQYQMVPRTRITNTPTSYTQQRPVCV